MNKNLCYVVTVHYLVENGEGKFKSKECTFISLHSIKTEKCRNFAKQKAKEDKQFSMFQDEWLSQKTIPKSDYCR